MVLDDLKASLTKDTILVSIMWVNNIIGSINPMKDIIEIVKKNSHAKLHSDMVQGFAKIKPDFAFNDIDLITITMHKLEGLKGIGLLISNKNLKLEPIIYGGHQQLALRPGTLDTGLIVSAAKTIRLALEKQDASYYYVQDLANYLKNKLNKLPFIIINAPSPLQSPYIVSISFTNIKGETAMHYLEKADIYVGIGSACNEKIQTLERTILAISLDKERANNMIRISLSTHNTKEDIDLLVNKLQELGSK